MGRRIVGWGVIVLALAIGSANLIVQGAPASASLREGSLSLNLGPLLLTLGQVPAGWTANVSSDPPDTRNHCPVRARRSVAGVSLGQDPRLLWISMGQC